MISLRHKCIFVHIPKTAGRSIESVFLRLHGLNWSTRAALLLRPNSDPAFGPPRLAHLKAEQYVSCGYVSHQSFESFFKFSIVRNPWDRIVSIYNYLGFGRQCNFREFVLKYLMGANLKDRTWFVESQHKFLYSAEGKLLVDFVGKFERLESDYSEIVNRLQLPFIPLPRVGYAGTMNARMAKWLWRVNGITGLRWSRSDVQQHYSHYYDQETIDAVHEYFQTDIQVFGYEFEQR